MLDKAYDAKKYEEMIYKMWEDNNCFHDEIDKTKKPFMISMPPPNATGTLHLGHAVMLAIEDLMVRHARMKGYCTLWLPGTDHAAIATQNKVEKILAEEGINRHTLGREKFLNRIRAYVSKSQDTIRDQVKKMGSSCDWKRERYTFDDDLSYAVNETFARMFKDGLIYRGYRIVNWCPRCASTLANDEVEYKEEDAKLYHIKYGPFVIATSRPETKLGDTAVAVHPDDKRYKDYIGKELDIDFVTHKIHVKVIAEKTVDPEFGSGVIGVTPAHSFVDFEMAEKNDLPIIQVINEEGNMTDKTGKYAGMSVLECRKHFLDDLNKHGLLEHTENYKQNLSICYRCATTIEPLMSDQWFIDVDKPIIEEEGKKKTLKEKCIEVVKNGDIRIVPDKFNKIYFHWMENLHNWCISRQIWWGHRIPVWYCEDCKEIIVQHDTPKKCTKCDSNNLRQDEDTLDTWFSAGLWTFSTLGWPKDTEELKYFHPTTVMETGYDILFFWVARMIIMSTYCVHDIPFKTVYLHGLIRTRDGQKMSKSNPETCIDPLEIIDKYGADALRLSMLIGSTPGNDTKLYEEKISGFRNFVNKLWNASRFTLMNIENLRNIPELTPKTLADKWIVSKCNKVIKKVNKHIENYNYSEAGQVLYDFVWSDFCDHYVEFSKEQKNESVIKYVLTTILKLLHPFIPFVTETIWQKMNDETKLIRENWPEIKKELIDDESEKKQEIINGIIKSIRHIRAESKVEPVKKIDAIIYGKSNTDIVKESADLIKKFARLENLEILENGKKPAKAAFEVISDVEIYIPFAGMIDIHKEKTRLKKELSAAINYLEQINKKLNNEKYVKNAPEKLVNETKEKKEITETRIEKLKKQVEELN